MIIKGTMIVRVQDDIEARLNGNLGRHEHQLGGDVGDLVVGDLAQERQVEPGEAVAGPGPAGPEDHLAARAIAGSSIGVPGA